MPSLSIIIPIYNVEQYLEKCLDSVLVDNGFTGQVVCVNDGSTDGSLAILERYAKKYKNVEVVSQLNAGLSAARNTGLECATGDYVLFLDSDDWLLPNKLEKVIGSIDGEDVIYYNAKKYYDEVRAFDDERCTPVYKHIHGQSFYSKIYDIYRGVPWVIVVGGIYLRLFLIKNGLRNEFGIYHEDSYFTPQVLLTANDVSCINEYVYAYRIRKGSITAHVTEKHIKDLLFVARNLFEKYNQKGNVEDVFYRDICNTYINLLINGYQNGISVHHLWKNADSRKMLHGAYLDRSRKIAKLTFLSPQLAYLYMIDALPILLRRVVNRFL